MAESGFRATAPESCARPECARAGTLTVCGIGIASLGAQTQRLGRWKLRQWSRGSGSWSAPCSSSLLKECPPTLPAGTSGPTLQRHPLGQAEDSLGETAGILASLSSSDHRVSAQHQPDDLSHQGRARPSRIVTKAQGHHVTDVDPSFHCTVGAKASQFLYASAFHLCFWADAHPTCCSTPAGAGLDTGLGSAHRRVRARSALQLGPSYKT